MPATYQITVNNEGAAPLSNVEINNPVPSQANFLSAGEGGQLVDNQVKWMIGELAPGTSRTVDIVLQARAPGKICNQASATADRGLSKQAEACTDFAGVAALALEVEDTNDPVEVDAATTYNITVRNPGSGPVTNVRIAATVPQQMTVTRAAGTTDNRKEGQKVIYEPITLQGGGEARFSVEVKAQRPGDVRFKVELTADQLTAGPVQQEESTTIYAILPSSRTKPAREVE
jgi:uncharacterized repeat protein (TIGR01451 family)